MKKSMFFVKLMCYAAVLCAVLFTANPNARAMTLSDLQGDYRIVEQSGKQQLNLYHSEGSIINLSMINGDLTGKVKKAAANAAVKNGAIVISSVYVDEGVVHCMYSCSGQFFEQASGIIEIYDGGQTLKVFAKDDPQEWFWRLKRL